MKIMDQEIRRRKMIKASEKYVNFLKASSRERKWLEDWESADLSCAPRLVLSFFPESVRSVKRGSKR